MKKTKLFVFNLLLSFVVAFLFILPDLIFKFFQSSPVKINSGMFVQVWIFALLSVFIHIKKLRICLWIFWAVFMNMELCHFAFFGVPSTPYTYIWMMGELRDTFDGVISSIHLYYAPLSVIISFAILFFIDKKMDKKIKRSKVATYILGITILLMAIDVNRQNRAFFYMAERESMPTFVATTRKTVFLFCKAVPKLLFRGYNTKFKPYEIEKISAPNKMNIIYIFGESGNPNFMSLYEKSITPTNTPNLDKYKNDKNFWFTKGFSSSVSTIYSVMMNFYMQREPENHDVQVNKKSDILQLAKDNGFKSYLIEAQGTNPDYEGKVDVVNLVASDVVKNGEEVVLNYFPKVEELSDKNLIVYHQDIMHFDYKDHYLKFGDKFKKFAPLNNSLSETKIAEYKNAVYYWDYIMGKVFDYAKDVAIRTKAPTYIVYMSDHGELIGGNKRGHSSLSKEVATIPVFVKCFNCDLKEFKNIKTATHYRVNEKVLHLLGVHLNNPNDDGKTFYINGKSLYGDDGFITIED